MLLEVHVGNTESLGVFGTSTLILVSVHIYLLYNLGFYQSYFITPGNFSSYCEKGCFHCSFEILSATHS